MRCFTRRLTRSAPLLLSSIGLALSVSSVRADVRFYTDPGAFQAALTQVFGIDEFEDIAPPDGFVNYGRPTVANPNDGRLNTSLAIYSVDENAELFANDADTYQTQFGSPFNLGSGDFIQAGNGAPANLFISPVPSSGNPPLNAIGLKLSTFDTPETSQVAVLALTQAPGNIPYVFSAPAGVVSYLGVISTEQIDGIMLNIAGNRADTLSVDSVTFASGVAPVPETSTLVGLAAMSGIFGVGLLRRRRARA